MDTLFFLLGFFGFFYFVGSCIGLLIRKVKGRAAHV